MLSNNNTMRHSRFQNVKDHYPPQILILNLSSSTLFALPRRTPTSSYTSASALELSTMSLVKTISSPPLLSFAPPCIHRNRFPSSSSGVSLAPARPLSLKSSSTPFFHLQYTYYCVVFLSAVTNGIKDVRKTVDRTRKLRVKSNQKIILFVDEVHRFNKF
ncbi:Replication-associated recombination protein A [Arachis hypogaea]|uniref:Uncharacterized protein n=1 Tax=Arachis hypogaea TaxID=3818 RepID=A0A444Y2Y6_ARAHY|nr:Replication-associated recombination protein A [Arachis hypogaea]RYQ96311.1 hypothetical protein Ahy_B08g092018 [Arachis hypogaea]